MISARWRTTFGLTAIVSIALSLTTVLIGLAAYYVTHEALELQLDHRVAMETQALLAEVGDVGLEELGQRIRQRDAAQTTASLGYILVDGKGRRLAGKLDATVPSKPGYLEFLHYGHDGAIAQAITTVLPGGERLVVAADRKVIDDMDATMAKLFSAALAAMLILGIGGAWIVGAVTRSRLRDIDATARAIIAGDRKQRIPISGTDSEFDRVSGTLNQMLDRIDTLVDNLRQVSSDVAHDLRTPLTRLQTYLEEAQLSSDATMQKTAIDAANLQAQELLALFSALLRISEVEAGRLRSGFRNVSLSEIAFDVVEAYTPSAETSGHHLTARIESGIDVHGDARLLRQLLANLLDNALRHTPAGTSIAVVLGKGPRGVILSVEDDGPGVLPGEAPRMFERFARAERSRSTSGYGLGLALVAAIARIHGGSTALSHGPGFRIDIELGQYITH